MTPVTNTKDDTIDKTYIESCDETKTVFGLPSICIAKGEHYVHDWDVSGGGCRDEADRAGVRPGRRADRLLMALDQGETPVREADKSDEERHAISMLVDLARDQVDRGEFTESDLPAVSAAIRAGLAFVNGAAMRTPGEPVDFDGSLSSFTLVGYYAESGQPWAGHVDAKDAIHAELLAIPDVHVVGVITGRHIVSGGEL